MNTSSHRSEPKSNRRPKAPSPAFDPCALAYEDVVSLAARLSRRGYGELAREFLAFANSPTGLVAFNDLKSTRRKKDRDGSGLPDRIAAIPYIIAASVLLRSRDLTREEVSRALLFFGMDKASSNAAEEEPPQFTD